jgi:hypothetical protein
VESFEGARLDAEKLDLLRQWGAGLSDDPREEVRAAGRAITMLVEEIDRLYVEFWHARDDRAAAERDPGVDNVETTLMSRIRGRVGPSRSRVQRPPA